MAKPLNCCHSCGYYSRVPEILLCAIHPSVHEHDYCPDYEEDSDRLSEEVWEPIGARYDGDDLRLLDGAIDWIEVNRNHPAKTGICPRCEIAFLSSGPHWDCPWCGWTDDSI